MFSNRLNVMKIQRSLDPPSVVLKARSLYLVQVDVVSEVHDRGSPLGKQLSHHGAVGLAVDVGHGVLQNLVKLRLLHLGRGKQLALQQLLGSGPQGRVVVQQPLDHLITLTDNKDAVSVEQVRDKCSPGCVLTCATCSFVLKSSGKTMGSCRVRIRGELQLDSINYETPARRVLSVHRPHVADPGQKCVLIPWSSAGRTSRTG